MFQDHVYRMLVKKSLNKWLRLNLCSTELVWCSPAEAFLSHLSPLVLASQLSSSQTCSVCPECERLQQPKGLQQQLLYPAAPPRSVRSQPVCVCVYPSELDQEPVITPHPLAAGIKWTLWHNLVSLSNSCWVVQSWFALIYGERSDKSSNKRAINM